MERTRNTNERSPLYTSKRDAEAKMAFIRKHGTDLDGAYRVANRLDKGQPRDGDQEAAD